MKLKDRIDAVRSRPRDPKSIPLSALDPMSKIDIAASRTTAKARMDTAMAAQREQARKAAA